MLNVASTDLFESLEPSTLTSAGKIKHGDIGVVLQTDPEDPIRDELKTVRILSASGVVGWTWKRRFDLVGEKR